MTKKQKKESKKSLKKIKKQDYKKMITEILLSALEGIANHWSPKKFESRIKKAVKLFSDGVPPGTPQATPEKERKI